MLTDYNIIRLVLGLPAITTWKASAGELERRLKSITKILLKARYPK